MSHILLIHGWCLDGSLWDRVLPLLAPHRCHVLDFGYFGPSHLEIPPQVDLVAAHSFGCLWTLQHSGLADLPMVAINGFARFSSAPDFPYGIPERVLLRMGKKLQDAPMEVIRDFQKRIQAPEKLRFSGIVNIEALARDLESLRLWDQRYLVKARPLHALGAEDDPLLNLEMSKQSFQDHSLLPAGGHLLPWTQPESIAQAILQGLA